MSLVRQPLGRRMRTARHGVVSRRLTRKPIAARSSSRLVIDTGCALPVSSNALFAVSGILPQEALTVLSSQLHTLVAAPPGRLGIGLIVSLSITIWSATSGTGVLMQALTIAYEEQETRGLVPFYVRAIALTLGVGLLAVLSLFLIAVVPAVIGMLPLPELWRD